jgi:hypothetical protein
MPTFSISGNAGHAAATVIWATSDFATNGSVLADGSGNYTISGLAAGDYVLNPSLMGFSFSPQLPATISSTNVTGINFTATALPSGLTFTQLAADPLNGANVSPLSPTNWTIITGFDGLQIKNNVCQAIDVISEYGENFTGVALPANQYAEFKLASLTDDQVSAVFFQILSAADLSVFESLTIEGDGVGTLLINVSNVTDNLTSLFGQPFSIGDVFRIAAIGTQIIVYQNGTQIAGVVDASRPASGVPSIDLSPATLTTDATVTHFAAGSVTTSDPSPYSSPDCRNFATFPNTAVLVNGTETYTVQQFESRTAGAPVDSRTAGAPVPSGTYPQNSRTPGTFGPGE